MEAVRCCAKPSRSRETWQVIGDPLHDRLDPASAPRRSKALAALCADLNDIAAIYSGTILTLEYSVKDHPVLT